MTTLATIPICDDLLTLIGLAVEEIRSRDIHRRMWQGPLKEEVCDEAQVMRGSLVIGSDGEQRMRRTFRKRFRSICWTMGKE